MILIQLKTTYLILMPIKYIYMNNYFFPFLILNTIMHLLNFALQIKEEENKQIDR